MATNGYPAARAKLESARKRLLRELYHVFRYHAAFTGNVNAAIHGGWQAVTEEFINDVVLPAATAARKRSRSRGFDGYKYKIVEVQIKYANGLSSKGKAFAERVYWIAAVELVLELVRYPNFAQPQAVLDMLVGAATDSVIHADMLARNWKWDRPYDPNFWHWASDYINARPRGNKRKEAKPHLAFDDERRTHERANRQREDARTWEEFFKTFFGKGGFQNYGGGYAEHKPEPKPWRANDWAYSGEAALNGQNWFEVLSVTEHSNPEEVRKAYRQAMRTAHPDKGGDTTKAAAVTAAYRVAKKILHFA